MRVNFIRMAYVGFNILNAVYPGKVQVRSEQIKRDQDKDVIQATSQVQPFIGSEIYTENKDYSDSEVSNVYPLYEMNVLNLKLNFDFDSSEVDNDFVFIDSSRGSVSGRFKSSDLTFSINSNPEDKSKGTLSQEEKLDGFAVLQTSKEMEFRGTFEKGLFKSGTITYKNGDSKEGTFQDQKLHGDNCTEKSNFFELKGKFNNGVFIFGKARKHNGDLSEGSFQNGFLHGENCTGKSNGLEYKGTFDKGNFIFGKATDHNGDSKEGSFQNGVLHGENCTEKSNGFEFKGTFEKGIFKTGKITIQNGDSWEGPFQNGKIHGEKCIEKSNGFEFKGTFEEGIFKSGKIMNQNGDSWEGSFQDGKLHGNNGIYINSDGVVYQGVFENGVYISEANSENDDFSKKVIQDITSIYKDTKAMCEMVVPGLIIIMIIYMIYKFLEKIQNDLKKMEDNKREESLSLENERRVSFKKSEKMSEYLATDNERSTLYQRLVDRAVKIGNSVSELTTRSAFIIKPTPKENDLEQGLFVDNRYTIDTLDRVPHTMELQFNGFSSDTDFLVIQFDSSLITCYPQFFEGDSKVKCDTFLKSIHHFSATSGRIVPADLNIFLTEIQRFSLESIVDLLTTKVETFRTYLIDYDLENLVEIDRLVCDEFPSIETESRGFSLKNLCDNSSSKKLDGGVLKIIKQYKEHRKKLFNNVYLDQFNALASILGELKQYSYDVQDCLSQPGIKTSVLVPIENRYASFLTMEKIKNLYNTFYKVTILEEQYKEKNTTLSLTNKEIQINQDELLTHSKNNQKKSVKNDYSAVSARQSQTSAFTMFTRMSDFDTTKVMVQSAYLRTTDYGEVINLIQNCIKDFRKDEANLNAINPLGFDVSKDSNVPSSAAEDFKMDDGSVDSEDLILPELRAIIPLINYSLGEFWRRVFTARINEKVDVEKLNVSYSVQTIPLHRSHGGFHVKDRDIESTKLKEVKTLIENFNHDYLENINFYFKSRAGLKSPNPINTTDDFVKFIIDKFIEPNRLTPRETSEGSHTCIKIPELIIDTRGKDGHHTQKGYVQTHMRLLMLELRYENWLKRNK